MQFSVGDKVVHPYHGAGQITGLEQKELLDEAKRYFIIEIPARELTVFIPRTKMDSVGVRLAMSRAKYDRVMDILRSRPKSLPEDYKERQALIWEQLKTGRAAKIAKAVRDLIWHRHQAHLTKKDTDYLKRGREFLTAEMALVAGTDMEDINKVIDEILENTVARFSAAQRAAAEAD